MKRLLKKADAIKLQNANIKVNPTIAQTVIKSYVDSNTAIHKGNLNQFVSLDPGANASFGAVSEDFNYVCESYIFTTGVEGKQNPPKWCGIIVAPIAKILDGTLNENDISVSTVYKDDERYSSSFILNEANKLQTKDGTMAQFSDGATEKYKKQA